VSSDVPITLGSQVFGVDFECRDAVEGSLDVRGYVALIIDGRSVGARTGVRMGGFDAMETISAGRSVAYAVTADYVSPNPFPAVACITSRSSSRGPGLRMRARPSNSVSRVTSSGRT
jgi:hypothetical protein